MKPFPGPIEKTKSQHPRHMLNDEQKEWLVKWFPVTENRRLAKAMGIGQDCLRKFARSLDLSKSEAGMKAIKKRQTAAMRKTNIKNGCYDRKRGHPPSEATMQGNRRRWEEQRQGLREDAVLKLKRTNPKKYAERIRKMSEGRKDLIRKEKMRIMYGTADPSHRYFLLTSDGKRFIFGYDSQEHHPEPAFMADVHGGQNP